MRDSGEKSKHFGDDGSPILRYLQFRKTIGGGDVADPGPEFFHPGSRIQGQKDARIRIRIKDFKFLTQKIVYKLSEL